MVAFIGPGSGGTATTPFTAADAVEFFIKVTFTRATVIEFEAFYVFFTPRSRKQHKVQAVFVDQFRPPPSGIQPNHPLLRKNPPTYASMCLQNEAKRRKVEREDRSINLLYIHRREIS